MTQRTGYPDGAPCWADLNTPDLQGAQRFYGRLLGWTFDEGDPEMGHYAMCRKDGKTVAGIAPKMPGQDMPTVWSVYLKSPDVEATARKIAEGGGTILAPPMDIPGAGRMLFALDPTGAAFGAWQPASHTGAELHEESGSMRWHEVNTREGARADAFYSALFSYTLQPIGDGKSFDYTVFNIDDKGWFGRMQMTAEWGDLPPHWMTYFAVDDCDKATVMVTELGGKVMHGPFDSPHGRIAVVHDPYGAVFSIIDPKTTAAATC